MTTRTILRAWLLTGISDGLFATVLSVFFFNSTFVRLWQGVASVPLGRSALDGGTTTVVIGLALHFSVALWWSSVFLIGLMRVKWVGRVLAQPFGAAKVAAVYGPAVWLVMSLLVIPLFTKRPPSITIRWWVQFLGHAPFVGFPIAWTAATSGSWRHVIAARPFGRPSE